MQRGHQGIGRPSRAFNGQLVFLNFECLHRKREPSGPLPLAGTRKNTIHFEWDLLWVGKLF